MALKTVLVKWDLSDPTKPIGRAIDHEGCFTSTKIVFPERGAGAALLPERGAGGPLQSVLWECRFVCDTKPQDPRRGAVIVRPLRELTWDWQPVGPALWGVREQALRCPEYPGLDDSYAPKGYEFFLEKDRRNSPWREACDKQQLWSGSRWVGAQFLTHFGTPRTVRASGEGQAVLVYEHGEKEVDARSLIQIWASTSTGTLREQDARIEAEFCLAAHPHVRFWDDVAQLSGADAYSPPYTMSRFEGLDAATQGRVLAILRGSAPAPEDMARAYWQQQIVAGCRGQGLDIAWAELAALHAPAAEIRAERRLGQTYFAESDDGYRPSGSYEEWFIRERLYVGGQVFTVSDAPERLMHRLHDVETARRQLIAEHWRQIDEPLACPAPELTTHNAEISGMPDTEWAARYHSAWTALVDEHRRDHAAQAAKTVRRWN